MYTKIDLHTHTLYSDGALTPCELVQLAYKNEINTLSITDHDSVYAIKEATECALDLGIELITGVEISTDLDDKEIHLLAYFIDLDNDELQKYLQFFRDERIHRAKRIVKKLQNLGLKITFDDVLDHAKNSAVGRPHIAYAMADLGIVKNYQEAFEKYIGDYGPAFERKIHVSPQSALKLINDAGGLSFIAHPGFMKENLLMSLIKTGVDGIETIHPCHNENQIQFYRGIVNQYCLLESGGSDFHGGKKMDNENLGKYYISGNQLDAMRKMLQKNNA
ncbi:MAG: PHP domain-containing protein [Ignavibacteria bacterium]|nr:MAG: PHP domain-containing protein [Ignavibacteria bacterium]KAF0161355.1 MAG: PHP domain-containing protein [Ignavibacteria bacterium]